MHGNLKYCIRQNFRWQKFSPKAHTILYWDKNFAKFNFINHVSYLPGSCGWSLRVAMHICMCTHNRANVSKFSLCKKIHRKNFHQWYTLAKIFSWQKFPHIQYRKFMCEIYLCKLCTSRVNLYHIIFFIAPCYNA